MHGADVDVLIHYDMCKEEDREIRNDVCRFPEREDEGRKGIGGVQNSFYGRDCSNFLPPRNDRWRGF